MSRSGVEHGAVTHEGSLGTAQKGFKAVFEGGLEVGWWRKGEGILGAKRTALRPFYCPV